MSHTMTSFASVVGLAMADRDSWRSRLSLKVVGWILLLAGIEIIKGVA